MDAWVPLIKHVCMQLVALVTLRTYVVRRLILLIPTFFLISIILFALIHLAPGDPIRAMFGPRQITPEVRERLTRELGLDQPIPVQYLIWMSNVLRGDLGYSYITSAPVFDMISVRIPRTVELMFLAEIVSVVIGIVLGVISAVKHQSLADAASTLWALIGYSTPNFWIGLMAIMVLAVGLGWFPVGGMKTSGVTFPTPFHALLDHLSHATLPVFILAYGWAAYLLRLVRSSMLEVLRQDYITTARAKGLKERVVIYKHALRNALLPVVTYEGYSMGFLLGGAVVIEEVFTWLGLGHFMINAATNRDYPILMGLSIIIALMVLIANLCADIAYAIVDPRITYE